MAKKKIKKFLKKVAPLAIAGLGAAMLGNRRRNQANVEMGLPVSRIDGRDFGPYKKSPTFIKPKMMTAQDMANDPMFMNAETLMNDTRMFKKGGRVVKTGEKVAKRKKKIGIQIKGFGKARRG